MARPILRGAWLRGARVGLALALVAPSLAALVGRGALVIHPCVSGDGPLGWLGLRLAILRPEAACPVGTFAVDGQSASTVSLLVVVALPLLATHLASLAVALGLVARLRAALGAVRLLLAGVLRQLPARPSVRTPARHVPLLASPDVPVSRPDRASPWRRGPPAGAFA